MVKRGSGRLHVVAPGESAPTSPMSVVEAATSGAYRPLLAAMRVRLAQALERTDVHPRDVAELAKRLMDVSAEIDRLDAPTEGPARTAEEPVADRPFNKEEI